MANPDDLKSMVMSFRVSELQVLLGFAGRSKSGKKHELMGRAVSLVERGCSTPIQIKIRELYKRRFPGGSPQGKSPAGSSSSNSKPASPARHAPYPSAGASITSGQPPGYSMSRNQSEYSGRHSSSNQIPVHPDVKFKHLPFYDNLGELLKPSSLVPRNSSRFQETFFIFHLTPQQAQDIAMSGDPQPDARMEYNVQIQLRFCLLETSCEQNDEFPPSICVRVNGKMAPLPNPIPTNKPGMEPKRPRRPVNITSICRISPTVSNHISVSWASELGRSYCVCVNLVRKLNASILLGRLKQRGSKHPDHTRALIKEKLAHDPDSEIATTSLRVSLMCPLGKMRMSSPCRASTCNHLQCFDAPTFLQMNEKKPTWQCPVCDRAAEFDNLIIDGYFTEILKVAAEATEIQFSEDGQWQPLKQKEKGSSSPEPITMITGDDTPEEQSTSSSSKKNEAIHVIDLTESDDEDMPEAIPASPSSDSNPTIITTKPPTTCGTSNNGGGGSSYNILGGGDRGGGSHHQQNSGCVSPPIISLDSPSRLSYSSIHSPPSLSSYSPASVSSLPRSPQSVSSLPTNGHPRSPYSSSSSSSSNFSSSSHNSASSPHKLHSPVAQRQSSSPPTLNPITHLPLPHLSTPYGYPPTPSLTSSLYQPPPAHSNSRPTPPPQFHRDILHSLYGPSDSSSNEPDFENLLGFMGDLRRSPPAAHQPFSSSLSSSHLSPSATSHHSYSAASSSTYEAGYALPLTKQDRQLNTPSPPCRVDGTLLLDHDPLLSTP